MGEVINLLSVENERFTFDVFPKLDANLLNPSQLKKHLFLVFNLSNFT